jgi:hypothetical protein
MVVTLLCFSNWAVGHFGCKYSLCIGCFGFFLFTIGFTIAKFLPSVAWPCALGGAVFGGIGAGILWAGQGVYFARQSGRYAEVQGYTLEDASIRFGGLFAAILLVGEFVLKAGSTGVLLELGEKMFFAIYTLLALLSMTAMATIEDAPDECADSRLSHQSFQDRLSTVHFEGMFEKIGAVTDLILKERKLQLLAFTQATFGFFIVFLNFYVNGFVTKRVLGKEYIGIMAALEVFVGAFISVASPWINKALGNSAKPVLLTLGALGFASVAFPFFIQDASQFEFHQLVGVYSAAGIGRASFEWANRGTFVDMVSTYQIKNDQPSGCKLRPTTCNTCQFPHDKEAAMPVIVLISGSCTFIGFLVFQHLSPQFQAAVLFSCSLLGICTYQMAAALHARETAGLHGRERRESCYREMSFEIELESSGKYNRL